MKPKERYIRWMILMVLTLSFFAGCKKDSDLPPTDMGYRYYPIQPGHWISYQVDSIAWDDFTATVDTFQFQIMERFESEFIDDQGRNSIRIERYKRDGDTSSWAIKDVWYSCRTTTTVEKTEENIRLLKMIFPIEDHKQWNGNIYNTLEAQDYEYTDVHTPMQYGSFHFDSTTRVLQREEYTQISENLEEEVFATGVGLVYKRYVNLEKLPTGQITKGTDFTYQIIGWGDQ